MDVEDESGSEDDGDSGLEDEMSEEEGAGGKRKRGKVRRRGGGENHFAFLHGPPRQTAPSSLLSNIKYRFPRTFAFP